MRVKSALSNDAEYKYEGVDVTTFKGTVQLNGFVDTSAQKSRAGCWPKVWKMLKNSKTISR